VLLVRILILRSIDLGWWNFRERYFAGLGCGEITELLLILSTKSVQSVLPMSPNLDLGSRFAFLFPFLAGSGVSVSVCVLLVNYKQIRCCSIVRMHLSIRMIQFHECIGHFKNHQMLVYNPCEAY